MGATDDTSTAVVTHTALHSRGATSAICADPTSSHFCSVGYGDKMVRLWDLSTNAVVACLDLNDATSLPEDVYPTSCCFSEDGQLLVVGLETTHIFPEPLSPEALPEETEGCREEADPSAAAAADALDDATEPTNENSSVAASSSATRSRTNTMLSDDDDRSEKGSRGE